VAGIVWLFTSFQGRISRRRFWFGVLLLALASIVLTLALTAIGLGETRTTTGFTQLSTGERNDFTNTEFGLKPWGSFVLFVLLIVPWAALGVKRRHDRGASGLDLGGFIAFVAIVEVFSNLMADANIVIMGASLIVTVWAICLFVLLGCLKGTAGPNSYGPDPLQPAGATA